MAACSILERLPREIRDLIWKDALVCDVIDVTPPAVHSSSHQTDTTLNEIEVFRTRKTSRKYRPFGTPISPKLTALLHTCRQIQYEATPIFYAYNNFQINIAEATLSLPIRWLSSLPSEGRLRIKNFTILFGAGNEDLFSKLIRETTSFDSINMSLFVNAPRILREKNLQAISNTLGELKGIENFKHEAINLQFDRQAAGMWEWVSWRTSWAKCLKDMADTFVMPGREEIGCDCCRRIGCVPRVSCGCREVLDDEALEA